MTRNNLNLFPKKIAKAIYFLVISLVTISCQRDKEKGFFDDGSLRYEVELKAGKRHGTLLQYYDNGSLEIKSQWRNGEKHGKTVSYYRNGRVMTRESFINDKADGTFVAYDSLGNIEEEVDYEDGLKQGKYIGYFSNGDTMIVGNYKQDRKHGKATTFYENNKVKDKQIYENGRLVYNVTYTEGGAFYGSEVQLPIDIQEKADHIEITLSRTFYDSTRVGVVIGDLDSKNQLLDTAEVLGAVGTTIRYPIDSKQLPYEIEGILYEIDMSDDIIKAQMPFRFDLN